MKIKSIPLYLLLLFILILTSCSNKPQNSKEVNENNGVPVSNNKETNPPKEELKYSAGNFMPKKINMKISYLGGFENGGEQTYVEYSKDNRVQIKTFNGGTTVVKVLEERNDGVFIVYRKEESYEKKNVLSLNSSKAEVYLKNPIKVGTNWKANDDVTKTITAVDMDLNTKAGKFKVVEVTSQTKEYTFKEYFAENLGLIKTVFTTNGAEFITEIKAVEENSPLIESYRFFYYNPAKDKILYMDKNMAQQEASKLKNILDENLKNAPSKEFMSIKATIKVNKIELSEEKGLVNIDFSNNFVKEMNLGSGTESSNLQAIVNTLGYNYKVDKVLITLDGKPYSSGHIIMKKDEAFSVNYDGCFKMN